MLSVVHGDITLEEADAIVCPANNFLQFHGGVAAAVLRRGGKEILEEADEIVAEKLMIPTGNVEVTTAGRMNSKVIIHAVGPNLNDPSQLGLDRALLLTFAINNTLEVADQMGCHSISIPAIATGSFGFPKRQCADIMLKCAIDYVKTLGDEAKIKNIRFINNDMPTAQHFVEVFDSNLLANTSEYY